MATSNAPSAAKSSAPALACKYSLCRRTTETQRTRRRAGACDMLQSEQPTQEIIGAPIEVHRNLGPGLLESAYEICLCKELALRGIEFRRQVPLPVQYKGVRLDAGYRVDILVADKIVLELKCVDTITDLHRAQLLTYLKLGGKRVGLILNFHSTTMKDGIARMVL